MTRPTRITPNPIIDAVVELRYTSSVPAEAIFGMLFSQVKSKYPNFKKLPITDIPEEIRKRDQNLQFAPHYQAERGSYRLNVGPSVVSLVNTGKYSGWEENFFPELKELLNRLEKSGVVDKFVRIGIRYVDFFELNIFEKIKLSIKMHDEPVNAIQQTYNALFQNEDFLTRVQVLNNIEARVNNETKIGSVIDTDTYLENKEGFSFEGIEQLISDCHELSVTFFFNLLADEFLKTLRPEYEP